jgi:hypothetical protein
LWEVGEKATVHEVSFYPFAPKQRTIEQKIQAQAQSFSPRKGVATSKRTLILYRQRVDHLGRTKTRRSCRGLLFGCMLQFKGSTVGV